MGKTMAFHRKWILAASSLVIVLVQMHPASGRQKSSSEGQTIRLTVEMVSLPVVVTDRTGARILDLQKDDFEVFEDGVAQEIAGFALTDEPVSIALAIDTSGSVENQLAHMQNEAIHFVNLLHPDDSVAIMSFAEDVQLLEDWSIDRERNARGIKETRHGTCTKVYEAVWLGLEDVLEPVRERNALVLFTDGEDTASQKASQKETVELAKETRATIYTVYFQPDSSSGIGINVGGYPHPSRIPTTPPIIPPSGGSGGGGCGGLGIPTGGHPYLQELADYTGGKVFDAHRFEDLGPAFDEVAKELASQYSIGYYSTNNKRDGKFRRVQVKVKRQGLAVRTKKGYYAPKDKD
jgi:Ca-activated chloride channel family protein